MRRGGIGPHAAAGRAERSAAKAESKRPGMPGLAALSRTTAYALVSPWLPYQAFINGLLENRRTETRADVPITCLHIAGRHMSAPSMAREIEYRRRRSNAPSRRSDVMRWNFTQAGKVPLTAHSPCRRSERFYAMP